MSKTSQQWWDEVKADEKLLSDWLVRQYRGEVTAAKRINQFAELYASDDKNKKVLNVIAEQEAQHASWIRELLATRNIKPSIKGAEKRYWKETLSGINSLESGAAVAAHAEAMRLERIRVIAADESAPADIRHTFILILRDEQFHEYAFRAMAGEAAMAEALHSHREGRKALGLVP